MKKYIQYKNFHSTKLIVWSLRGIVGFQLHERLKTDKPFEGLLFLSYAINLF